MTSIIKTIASQTHYTSEILWYNVIQYCNSALIINLYSNDCLESIAGIQQLKANKIIRCLIATKLLRSMLWLLSERIAAVPLKSATKDRSAEPSDILYSCNAKVVQPYANSMASSNALIRSIHMDFLCKINASSQSPYRT